MKVEIYSTPTCSYCDKAKTLFKENNIEYHEYDVKENLDRRKEMIERSGQMGVPVIAIDGEYMAGFDKDKLEEKLGLK